MNEDKKDGLLQSGKLRGQTIAERKMFWAGTLPSCPETSVHLGGIAFGHISNPVIESGPSGDVTRDRRLGLLQRITKKQLETCLMHMKERVIKHTGSTAAIYSTENTSFEPDRNDDSLDKHVYIVPSSTRGTVFPSSLNAVASESGAKSIEELVNELWNAADGAYTAALASDKMASMQNELAAAKQAALDAVQDKEQAEARAEAAEQELVAAESENQEKIVTDKINKGQIEADSPVDKKKGKSK